MSYHSEEIQSKKRELETDELCEEDIYDCFPEDKEFAALLIGCQNHYKKIQQEKEQETPQEPTEKKEEAAPAIEPPWKIELQKKIQSAQSLEDLDGITKEIVKKNRARKLPKKKLVRVENFYLRHCSGLTWMNNFIGRTKADAVSRPYVERMLQLENQFKKQIEEDELLGPQLKDE
jgi:hypothetical protein